jgi:hypothetical protein
LTALPLILAVTIAATPLPFADGPPWDATYSGMGEALTAAGWEVRGDGETLFAFSGPLELTLRWDDDGFLASVTAVERWGDEEEAGRAFDTRRSELSVTHGEPAEAKDGYARWEADGCDVVLEVDHIFGAGGKVPVVLVRYLRNET